MRITKTLRSPGCTFSKEKGLVLHAPRSWRELSQAQLRYVYSLLGTFSDLTQIKTFMFMRFCGIHVQKWTVRGVFCFMRGRFGRRKFFMITANQVQSLIHQFDFIDSFDNMSVRLDSVRGCRAVDVNLHGISFIDYLSAETAFQVYLSSKRPENLEALARILYRKRNGDAPKRLKLDIAERTCVFAWYCYVKAEFARQFPSFFRPAGGEPSKWDLLKMINVQLRALTQGDVTKEDIIKNMDCWRALTELNEKAREAAEFEAKYGK